MIRVERVEIEGMGGCGGGGGGDTGVVFGDDDDDEVVGVGVYCVGIFCWFSVFY